MSEKKSGAAKNTKKSEKSLPQGFHPKEHKINVVMSDGSKMEVLTSWGKEGATMYLDVDSKNHPAWQEKGKSFVNESNAQVSRFKDRFGDL